MIGIYCWTNLITQEKYIGQSINIEQRKKAHIRASYNIKYHNKIYKSMRQYGVENFKFEIIEECDLEKLNEREIYWIAYYNSCKNGLNMNSGGTSVQGESNPNTSLTNDDVLSIGKRVYINKEDIWDVYLDYETQISECSFWSLVHGVTWKTVDTSMIYSLKERSYHNFDGSKNPKAVVDENNVRDIRIRHYQGETNQSIFIDYQNKISYSAFCKIIQGVTWKNIMPELINHKSNNVQRQGVAKAKLTADDVKHIRYLKEKEGYSNKEIYSLYPSVTPKTIQRVINYETWKNITCND